MYFYCDRFSFNFILQLKIIPTANFESCEIRQIEAAEIRFFRVRIE